VTYAIGIDFGTESARALLVDCADGAEVAVAVHTYESGVIDEQLNGVPLEPEWALQDPADYMSALQHAVPQLLAETGDHPGNPTMSLAARLLEENGISTVVMGCAKDIVEYIGVPRLLFSDFPLGNAAGRPNDHASQRFTLDLGLHLLEAAPAPRTTVQSPLRWSDNPDWKLDYCNIERLSPEEIAARRAEFDAVKAQGRQLKEKAGVLRSQARG